MRTKKSVMAASSSSDRAVGFRSEGTLIAERHEGGKELPFGLRPLRRPLHHLLQQLGERLPEEVGPVPQCAAAEDQGQSLADVTRKARTGLSSV